MLLSQQALLLTFEAQREKVESQKQSSMPGWGESWAGRTLCVINWRLMAKSIFIGSKPKFKIKPLIYCRVSGITSKGSGAVRVPQDRV